MKMHAESAKTIKKPTSISISQKRLAEGKSLEVKASTAAETGLACAIADKRAELWMAENRAALDNSNAHVEKNGLPLAKYRRF